jgi:hypothetical protein
METKETNWFVRILIMLLSLFIALIIVNNIVLIYPNAEISYGLIVLIAFLIVLILSESFDNFSIGKIISLQRSVQEKDKIANELKIDNRELRNQLIHISTSISNHQVNSQTMLGPDFVNLMKLAFANDNDKKIKQLEDETHEKEIQQENVETTKEKEFAKYIPFSKFESIAFQKLVTMEHLEEFDIMHDTTIVSIAENDPISNYNPVFDGYFRKQDTDVFIEIRPDSMLSLRDRLYQMLSKIYYYKMVNKVNSVLYLVLVSRPDRQFRDSILDKLKSEFEPALLSSLLVIKKIDISKEEFDKILSE